ncbi:MULTISPECIES: tyrosine-type recombinase/integrase [unclassified Aeromicrobium]|uniref:tyrosine-type recombinase/integrase n=1 Tax=unclassified Aeromicrobium TaxID=2633570 RepID=UPI0028896B75|nr:MULTISPECIES: tyrosine-type recombinase/integrase [unclassified Aeromicrobium]
MRAIRRSAGTIKLHRHYLKVLAEAHADPLAVTHGDLVAMLDRPTWQADARRSARSVWRGFYRWCHGRGYMDEWIGEQLPAISSPRRLPRPTPERLVDHVVSDPRERSRFMASLAAHCGLRAAEVAQVHRRDYDRHNRVLLVHGKGAKERLVPVENDELHTMLSRVDTWAFPSPSSTSGHLTAGYVSRLLSEALGPDWTGHTLRHRYASTAYEGTGDILAVSQLLGHASVGTTQVYTKVSVAKLRAAARAAA